MDNSLQVGPYDTFSIVRPSRGGTRAAYLADRLRTHYPEVFAAMEHDEYQSVHAAAVDAGIRKKMVQHIATVEGFAKAACNYLTPDE